MNNVIILHAASLGCPLVQVVMAQADINKLPHLLLVEDSPEIDIETLKIEFQKIPIEKLDLDLKDNKSNTIKGYKRKQNRAFYEDVPKRKRKR